MRHCLPLIFLLACADKSDDSADGTSASDGGTTDGGVPSDGGGTVACAFDWTGAPCSHEWEALFNCDECGVSYTCRESGEPLALRWHPVAVHCACVDLATGALLTHLPGCEDAGGTATTTKAAANPVVPAAR
ncbi:hypothetical protein L6R53_32240 [Myxococcota bacterium]|nr:hypothetical protein [Myxococcota bacterium]